MQNFLGNPCPYCGKNFTADDDIVVCPECGTPHHRECYNQMGFCANEGSHSETFEWKGVNAAPVHKTHRPDANENSEVVCPACGKETSAKEKFCVHCGAELYHQPSVSPEEEFRRERERILAETLGEDLGGITAKEALIFVRTNGTYFLPRFKAFKYGAKFDTNFSAFIFSYFYLFYRKMYGLGALVFIVTTLLSIPTFLLDFATLQNQYLEAGMLTQIIWEVPHQQELAVYSIIASLIIWGIRILLMLFFNRLYYAKVVGSIKGAREGLTDKSQGEVERFFRTKGGTSMVVPALVACLVFAASFALALFIVNSGYFVVPDIQNFLPKQ